MLRNLLKVALLIAILSIPNSLQKKIKKDSKASIELKAVIASAARKLSLADFKGDPLVLQTVDEESSITKYQDTIKNVLFKSQSIDSEKDVIVHSTDDEKSQNTFMVLRKSPRKSLYYITYAYVRNATSLDEISFTVGSTQRCIEWDSWENRQNKENSNWIDCSASMIVSCAYNDSLVGEPVKNPFVKQLTSPEGQGPVSLTPLPFQAEEGYTADFNAEFFEDIDDVSKMNDATGRSMGNSGKTKLHGQKKNNYIRNKMLTGGDGEPQDYTNIFILVKVIKKLPNGKTEEVKEFIPCTSEKDCKGDRYKKICQGSECQMKKLSEEDAEDEDADDSKTIYLLKWGVAKTKLKNNSYKEEKIKHYVPYKVYWKDCTSGRKCSMVQTHADDNLDNIKLYTVTTEEEPQESGDNFVVQSVNKFTQMSNRLIGNLYKNICTKPKNKLGVPECLMVKLIQWIDDDDEITTSTGNGEYKLYKMVLKTEIKTDKFGRKIQGKINKYETTKTLAAKKLFTNICVQEHCSMEEVQEANKYTTYKIVTLPRNTKLPNGKIVSNVSRFQAVSPKTTGNLFTKVCENGKTCVMKPNNEGTEDFVKFFKKIVDGRKKNTKHPGKIYVPIKIVKSVCTSGKCVNELVTSVEACLKGEIFEVIPTKEKQLEKIVKIEPESYDHIYYDVCSAKAKICGKLPILPEKQKYFRLVKEERPQSRSQSQPGTKKPPVDSKFVPTKIFQKICNGPGNTDCTYDLIENFDMSLQEEFKKTKKPIYFLTYESKEGSDGLKMTPHFVPLDDDSLNSIFKQQCENGIENCSMDHVDNLESQRVYRKLNVTMSGKPDTLTFEPIQLYKKVCKGGGTNCAMEPVVVTSEDLKTNTVFFEPKVGGKSDPSKNLVDYSPLDPNELDELYRKVCTAGKCVMKPLKEDEPNVYYELVSVKDENNKDFVEKFRIALLYQRVCKSKKPCEMEPFILLNDTILTEPLYIREVLLNAPGSLNKKYTPIPPSRQDKFFQKVCPGGNFKCYMKPIYEIGLMKEIWIPAKGNSMDMGKKYVPANVYKSECDKDGSNCDMKLLLPTDDNDDKFDLFELDNKTGRVMSSTGGKNRMKFKTFPLEQHRTLFRRVCTEDGCSLKPFFEDEGEIIILDKVIKPTELDNAPDTPEAESQSITPIQIYKKVCVDPTRCHMVSLSPKDDPRKVELYRSNATAGGPIKNYDAILAETLPKLFRFKCTGGKCKLSRLIPEDENTIYKKIPENEGGLEMVFIFKKVCPTPKSADCDMIPITVMDNPRKVNLYQMISEKNITKLASGEDKIDIVKTYLPIFYETHDGIFFRKVCDTELKTCVVKDLFDDKHSIYQQITIVPDTDSPDADEHTTEYRLINLYKKVCSDSDPEACEMEYISPEDDLRSEHLFELNIPSANGKKNLGRGISTKTYDPLADDAKFSLYRKVCKKIDCAYLPLIEDNDSIYKLTKKGKIHSAIFNNDQQEQKVAEYGLIKLYKNVCPGGDQKKCKMNLITANSTLPHILFQLIVAKEAGKKEEFHKKYIHFNVNQYYRLYKKMCKGNTCQMIPLSENKVFRLIVKQINSTDPEKPGLVTAKKFIPTKLFTRNCLRGASCELTFLTDLDHINVIHLLELVKQNATDKNEPSSIYNPIKSEDLQNLYRKKCPIGGTGKCTMTPLIPQDVYIGKIYKVIQQDEKGEKKPDTELDLTPVHLFKKTCDPKKPEKNKCQMDLFTATDLPDEEGHYHLYHSTLDKIQTKLDNGETTINSVRKYFPIPPSTQDALYRKKCDSGQCFAKPIFDSIFYLWKNATRPKKSPEGVEENIQTEELIPLNLVIVTCTATGTCSVKPLTSDTEEIPPGGKISIQAKRSIKKTLPNGKEIDDTVTTNKDFTSFIRHHTLIKICPEDKACLMKPFGETKLGIKIDELEKESPSTAPSVTANELTTGSPEPEQVATDAIITAPPETTPAAPEVREPSKEPSVVQEVTTPKTEIVVVPEVTEAVTDAMVADVQTPAPPTTPPQVVTESAVLPEDVVEEEPPTKRRKKLPRIYVKLTEVATVATFENSEPTEPPTGLPESTSGPKRENIVEAEPPKDGTLLGELSNRDTAAPNLNEIVITTEQPGETTQIKVEGEIVIPEPTTLPAPSTIEAGTTEGPIMVEPTGTTGEPSSVHDIPVVTPLFETTSAAKVEITDSITFEPKQTTHAPVTVILNDGPGANGQSAITSEPGPSIATEAPGPGDTTISPEATSEKLKFSFDAGSTVLPADVDQDRKTEAPEGSTTPDPDDKSSKEVSEPGLDGNMTGLPDESDEYDDYPNVIDDPNAPVTLLKNFPNCPTNAVFETPIARKRIIFKTKEPVSEGPAAMNHLNAFSFETVDGKVFNFELPVIQNDTGPPKWLQIAYTSPTKQKYPFEFQGFEDSKIPLEGKKFTVTTPQGTMTLEVPHPSTHGPMNAYFVLKNMTVDRRLTNFKYVRQSRPEDDFDYNQPKEVKIEDIPDNEDKRYTIIFKTPDDVHITFIGKKKPNGPVVIRRMDFETTRHKNLSMRLPLFEVHREPDDEKWLDLAYTNKDALQAIKFPGVRKPKEKNQTHPFFKTPKGKVAFELPCDELTNLKIYLLLIDGEKYVFELPGLTNDLPEEEDPTKRSRKRKKLPEFPVSFNATEGRRVIFITNPPENIQDPFDVVQLDLEIGPQDVKNVPLPGAPTTDIKNPQTLVLIYTSPKEGHQTSFNFPMIQYNGEPEINIKTDLGKIVFILPEKDAGEPSDLRLKFIPKDGDPIPFTLKSFTVKPIAGAEEENPDLPPDEPLLTEIIIETPDNLLVTFLTEDKVYKPIFRVFEVKLQADAQQEFNIKFPAKNAPKNIQYLELDYEPPTQDKLQFQIAGLPFDNETMQPGKILTIDSAKGTLLLDFPKLRDPTRDNMRIIYNLKNSNASYTYDTPFLNLAGVKKKKKIKVEKHGVTMYSIDGKSVTVLTEGTAEENSTEVLIGTGLQFDIDGERNVTVPLVDKKKKPGKKYMELVYVQADEKPILMRMTGVPHIDPNFGASQFKLKSDAGIVIFDIPKPSDQSRAGVKLDLLLLNEDKMPYEVNGLLLKGTEEMMRRTKSSADFKYSVKTQNVFTDVMDKHVSFLSIGEPGSGNPLRVLEATFEIPGLTNVPVKIAKFSTPGVAHPKWLQIVYTSEDGSSVYFEIPGIPNESKEEDELSTRTVSFESNTKQETIKMIVPGPNSPKADFETLKFVLITKFGKKFKYNLQGFTFDQKIRKPGASGSDSDTAGRAIGFTTGEDDEHPEGTSQKLFYHPGWKIQYQSVKPNVTFDHEDDIFYGLGNCPYKRASISDLRKATTKEQIVKFYMTVLRTECLSDKQKYIHKLLKDGHLEVSGKYLRVPPKAKFITKPKLNHEEAQELSSSFEMEVVTRIYMDETTLPNTSPTDPVGSPISRSANFLTNLAISFITKSRSSCRLHFIRLSRHLLTTLKTGFMKLVQDNLGLNDCNDCLNDKKINYNDRLQLMGLIQFIIHGMGPVELGTLDVSSAFQHFYKINVDALKSRIK